MNDEGYFLVICLNPTIQKTIVLPRLSDGRVNRSAEHYLDASGKGVNVARALIGLGGRTVHLTHSGGRTGGLFLKLAREAAVDVRAVDSGSEVRFCYTLLSREAGSTTEIVEEAVPVTAGTEERVFDDYGRLIPGAHTVVISGTKAGGYSPSTIPLFVRAAREAGKTVILDVRGEDLTGSLRYGPDLIKPNYDEYIATFFPDRNQDDGSTERSVREHMLELAVEHSTRVVLTRGELECFYSDGGKIVSVRPPVITPVNTTGCGDAFCAGIAYGMHTGLDIVNTVELAIETASRAALSVRPYVGN
jgi:1-phosphofructokinase family hexose kinase